MNIERRGAVLLLGALFLAAGANAVTVTVLVENLAPENGVYFTPMWVGFHGGDFDYFDAGAQASTALERLAEDGDFSVLQSDFAGSGVDGLITSPGGFSAAPVFDPDEEAMAAFEVNPLTGRYFSYAAMIVPSNDAFIGNDSPTAIEIFDAAGNFAGKQIITILGAQVWDAGTEANTEMNAAFINQTAPNTGTSTTDPVSPHPGYIGSYANPGGTPIILGGTNGEAFFDPVGADFTLPKAVVARITIVPEPATLVLLLGGSVVLLRRRRI